MRVNSAFTGFCTNRLVVTSGIAIVMLAIFFIASSFKEPYDPYLRAKQVNLIIRQIGHRLLLQAGDSTSRVLPVTATKEGTFVLRFENEFVFNHDSLMVMSQGLLPKAEFPSGYAVTVHDCINGGIVYGFQVSNTSPDILACSGRSQPSGCYKIEFSFPDFYKSEEQKKAGSHQPTGSLKNDTREVNPKLAELKATTVDHNMGQRTGEFESVKVDTQEVNPKTEKLEMTIFDYPLVNVVSVGILVLLGLILLIGRFGKTLKPVPVQSQTHGAIKQSVPEFAALGMFLFNRNSQHLLLGRGDSSY